VDTVHWSAILNVLVRCEEATAGACGVLSFGAPPHLGGVFVEAGRICWAAAPGLQRRLGDLLREHAMLSHVDLEALFIRCRAEGKPLGRALLEENLIPPGDLEAALRRHSAESLVELCRDDLPTIWVPHSGRGYSPRLTFQPIEVLFDVVRLFHPGAQADAMAELGAVAGGSRHGGAFLVDDAREITVPVAELGGISVRELRALGRWSTSIATATRELGVAPTFTLAATGDGLTISVWWRGPLLFAVVCEDRATLAAVAARHLACE
jgi:hypothetical protein